MVNNKRTFIKISNLDIYQEIKVIESQLKTLEGNNETAHATIIGEHEKNKGRIEFVKWIASSALGIGVFLCANLIIKIL